jgi:hypothetical protein
VRHQSVLGLSYLPARDPPGGPVFQGKWGGGVGGRTHCQGCPNNPNNPSNPNNPNNPNKGGTL